MSGGIGSDEEVADVKAAYETSSGSIEEIMRHIPFSTIEDEPRLITLVDTLITEGKLAKLPAWTAGVANEKARLVRRKQANKEAKEAEALARELGVYDEFYGNGKEGAQVGRGKGQAKGAKGKASPKRKGAQEDDDEDEGDTSALQALILKKKKNMDGFFDGLAAKYAEPSKGSKGKGKKRAKTGEEEDAQESPKKRSRAAPPPPEIDDEEFAKLQSKLFGDKAKPSEDTARTKTARAAKGRKAK